MGRSKEQNEYIHNLARTIAGQLGINLSRYGSSSGSNQFAGRILFNHGRMVSERLSRYSSETLGKIAACGLEADSGAQFALCHVRDSGDRINWNYSGRELLVMLATTAVIAAIGDNLRAEHQHTPLAKAEPVSAGRGQPVIVPSYGGSTGRRPTLDQIEGRRDPGSQYEGRFGRFDQD